jgi:succinoglycan biosynthesis transport protein ExoP
MDLPDRSVRNKAALPGPQTYSQAAETVLPTITEFEHEDETIDLLEYWHVLVKYRWIIITAILATVALTAIATWHAIPTYQATVRIQIDPNQPNILPFKRTEVPEMAYVLSQEYLRTQFNVLESRTLARRVISKLKLDQSPEYAAPAKPTTTLGRFTKLWIPQTTETAAQETPADEDHRLNRIVDAFLSKLTASPIRNSRLVDVSFVSADPKLAADVANTLADEYIQMTFETGYNSNIASSNFLSKQLIALKARVEDAQEALVGFSQKHNIYELSEKENVIIQKLSDLNAALTAAETDRMQKEALWDEVRSVRPKEFPEILRNPLIKELETNLATLRQQQAKLQASFKEGWPQLDQLNSQVEEAERQLKVQWENAVRSAEGAYRAAIRQEILLRKALTDQKQESDLYNQNSIQYNILKRQADADKQLYEGMLQSLNEAGVSASLQSNNIHILDSAEVPEKPHRPRPLLNLTLAFAVGSLVGVGLAFFVEHLDRSIRTIDDIDRYLKLPSLGIIPRHTMPSLTANQKLLASQNTLDPKSVISRKSVEWIAYHDVGSIITEAYRNLRTSILLSAHKGHPPKCLLITSSQKGEGKTTTAINMSITLAQTGAKVILLDCDMRNPNVHKALNLKNEGGMSTFLSGNADLPSLIQASSIPNLSVVPSGPIPPNPAELVGSPRMHEGLSLLQSLTHYVVIDTPPVLAVADARILATVVDGVILVVKAGTTAKDAIRHTKLLLEEINARIIGILLNNVDIHAAGYSRYSYYYGYGKKKQENSPKPWWKIFRSGSQ